MPAARSAAKPIAAPTASATPARIASFTVFTPRPSATPAPANAAAGGVEAAERDHSGPQRQVQPGHVGQPGPEGDQQSDHECPRGHRVHWFRLLRVETWGRMKQMGSNHRPPGCIAALHRLSYDEM